MDCPDATVLRVMNPPVQNCGGWRRDPLVHRCRHIFICSEKTAEELIPCLTGSGQHELRAFVCKLRSGLQSPAARRSNRFSSCLDAPNTGGFLLENLLFYGGAVHAHILVVKLCPKLSDVRTSDDPFSYTHLTCSCTSPYFRTRLEPGAPGVTCLHRCAFARPWRRFAR